MALNKFRRNAQGYSVYVCRDCGKQTRDTGNGEGREHKCRRCNFIGETLNAHDDLAHEGRFEDCADCASTLRMLGVN